MGRRRIKGAAARDRIVRASLPLFADRGFYGASIRQLAEAAAVPTASLLHHFPTKERLYAAVLERVSTHLVDLLGPALTSPGDYAGRARRFVKRFTAWVLKNPECMQILLRELLDNPARLAQGPVTFQLRPPMDLVVDFVKAGQRAGQLVDIDPHFFMIHFFGSFSFYIVATPSLRRLIGDSRVLSRARLERESLRMVEQLLLP